MHLNAEGENISISELTFNHHNTADQTGFCWPNDHNDIYNRAYAVTASRVGYLQN